jgi:hypothetical protein
VDWEKIDKIQNEFTKAYHKVSQMWREEILFTWRWWLAVALSVIPWVWWWFFFRKKDSTGRLLYAGYFVIAISLTADTIGDQMGLWEYRVEVTPYLPAMVPWDLTLMPVVIMSLIQIKPHIKSVYKAIFFSLATAFVGEEFAIRLGLYKMLDWHHTYSVLPYIVIYLIANKLAHTKTIEPVTN